MNLSPERSYGRRRVDDPTPQAYTDPDLEAAIQQWKREREAYDKTAIEMGHRPWRGSHGGTQSKWG